MPKEKARSIPCSLAFGTTKTSNFLGGAIRGWLRVGSEDCLLEQVKLLLA